MSINNIDDEWSQFMLKSDNCSFGSNFVNFNSNVNKYNINLDSDSDNESDYKTDDDDSEINNIKKNNDLFSKKINKKEKDKFNKEEDLLNLKLPDIAPEPTNIYISTKSKIAYLNNPIDLKVFWKIPIISYYIPKDGIIKKQMKFNSKSKEELDEILDKLKNISYYEENIMSHIDNPNSRIKFKDIRKISIGMSKKDIMSYRSKKKQAFYNCFVLILRLKIDDIFREFHVKVFNTGQLEIPGIQNDEMFEKVLSYIINLLQPFHEYKLTYKEYSDTVLINSNFNCGFYINREVLYDLLKYKYGLQSIYDPCSYPGIQSKFYYNRDLEIQDGKQITSENKEKYKNIVEVSFMIFRTGSVLIVGKCDVDILTEVYKFLVNIFKIEFKSICQRLILSSDKINKQKNKKIRKKTIHNYLENENTLDINTKTKTTIIEEEIICKNNKNYNKFEINSNNINNIFNEIKEEYLDISLKKKKNIKKDNNIKKNKKIKKNEEIEFEFEN
jgi:hypothetical protein